MQVERGSESRAKLDLLIKKLQAKKAGAPREVIPRRADAEAPAEASFAQQRLWFLDQLDPGTATYNIAGAIDLEGPLSRKALGAAFDALVARHEILRTTFDADAPRQRVHPPDHRAIPLVDLSETADGLEDAANGRARSEARRPFDLHQGPLIRATLIRLAPERHRLILVLHHIVADGWSLGVLLHELVDRYRATIEGDTTPVAPLPIQYADFAVWQREHLRGERLSRPLDYWRERLADIPPLALPPPPAAGGAGRFDGDRRSIRIEAPLRAALEALAQRHETTLTVVVLAALTGFLARYTGQPDVTVGTPVAGRGRRAIEGLIGFFVNTLVLRTHVGNGRPSFATSITRAKETLGEAQAHQDVPFETLVEALQPTRDLDETPFFQVLLNVDTSPLGALEGGGVRFAPHEVETGISKFDLTLSLRLEDDALEGAWVYRTARFDAGAIERIDRSFQTFLRGVLTDADRPLADAPLLPDTERRRLVHAWSRAAESYPKASSLPDMVAAQAARTPDAVALVFEGTSMSYGELMARADRLARRLGHLGAGPETTIGICLQRSFELVVGTLAALRTGAAYVPIDPADPTERRRFVLADAGVRWVLTDPTVRAGLPELDAEGAPATISIRDGSEADGDATPRDDQAALPTITPESAAYVIYTSGSTGRPKGVVVSHGALANRLQWVREADLDDRVCFLQKTTVSFDVSVAEIFAPLVAGGRVAIARPGGQQDPDYLVGLIADAGVTHTSFPPSLLGLLLDEPRFVAYRGLRSVVTGGETVPAELPDRFYARLPDTDLENRYGPTEATISVTRWICRRGVRERILPIGRPIARAEIYLLDRELRPVPTGQPGELCIGGPSLARGYLGRPGRTAESFVPHPFADRAGERLYRSGDVARWREIDGEGVLEFVGRIDQQVKIRGFRVELGEVEAVLHRHPSVRELAVVDMPDGDTRRLAAYLVPENGDDVTPETLRGFLADHLPVHMIPSAFVPMERLPVTTSGKVDRRALPAPDWRRGEQAGRVAPRTDTERAVAAIFASLLEVDEVGAEDDFFELGGHSLLAARAMARVRRDLGADVALRTLFENTTVAGLAAAVDAAAVDTAAVDTAAVERSEGTRSETADPEAEILPDGPAPLSFAQERMWFLDQLDPGAAYNIAGAVRMRGELDHATLRQALEDVVTRQASLRTVFPTVDGNATVEVRDEVVLDFTIEDLRTLGSDQRRREAKSRARRGASTPFDLKRGPLLRTNLLQLADDEHWLVVVVHHIVADGWSIGVLVADAAASYRARIEGRAPVLPPLPVAYTDVARQQRQRLVGSRLEAQLAYWRRALDAVPVLELPTDRRRRPAHRGAGETLPMTLPAALTSALEKVARRHDATLFMVLLAGFQLLLGRWSRQRDFAVGTPVAGRDDVEVEGLIGLFVNTLALRVQLDPEATFATLLRQVRETTIEAFAHPEVPFEKLVETLQPDRNLAATPIFQVMLAWQNAPEPALDLPGIETERMPLDAGAAKFDLTLTLAPRGGEIRGMLEFDRDLFDPATARRLIRQLTVLLEGAAATPDTPIARLPLLRPHERAALLTRWSGDVVTLPSSTLDALVWARAAQAGDAVAVVDLAQPIAAHQELTFAALVERAESLAGRLMRHGIGPEDRIGLCLERGQALVVSMLAVVRAGAAYVPLDPSYPEDRLTFMAEDAGLALVLAERRTPPPLATDAVTTWWLDEADGDASGPRTPRSGPIDPDSIAYVIYTSGSTGRPKGVAISHRAAVNHMRWMQRALPLDGDDAVLHKTPISFDASVWELWMPLIAGARLVLAAPDAHRDVEALTEAIERRRITVFQGVPSLLELLAESPGLERRGGSLRRIFSGGEALPGRLVARLGERLQAEVINLYGPTEATIEAATWRCRDIDRDASRDVPIGHAIDNMRLHVVDDTFEPAPVGVLGELMIGGPGLARGYLGQPAQTAERFVPDPFTSEAGARLYRTGDIARRRDDGALVYAGRADAQVKLRGFRIELGEVEARLAADPEVARAAAIVHGETKAAQRLIGFVVPVPESGAQDLDTSRLLADLSDGLPEFMVPAALIVVDALPSLPNGKLDRAALARTPIEVATETVAFSEPEGPVEERIAGIFAEVLERPRIGRLDDFFALGGHSLLATRVAMRLRDAFDVELPLRRLFEAPTVAALAPWVEGARRQDATPTSASPIRARTTPSEGTDEDVVLSFGQERLWFLDQLDPGSAAYNLPSTIRLRGPLDVDALRASLETVVHRHESLRTVFSWHHGDPRGRIAPPRRFELELRALDHLAESERDEALRTLAVAEAHKPIDLGEAPLLRALLLRLDAADHVMLLVVHHIASDGWSVSILVREMAAAYRAHREDRTPELPSLPFQYPDFARWQRQWLQGEELESQLDYWRHRLDRVPVLELPTDRPRSAATTDRGALYVWRLDSSLMTRLESLGRGNNATLFMVLLAAYQTLLAGWSGQDDFGIGSPIAGRRRSEVEGLIGFFINTLVLRADLEGQPTFRELLGRVQATTLDAFARQDVPFEKVVENIDLDRTAHATPLFQTLFALQNAPQQGIEIDDLAVTVLPLHSGAAKYELSLTVGDGPEGMRGAFEYRTDLFDERTVRRLAACFDVLLEGIAASPDRSIAELPLSTRADRAALIDGWSRGATTYDRHATVVEWFARTATTHSAQDALCSQDRTWRYADLARDSAWLAESLHHTLGGPANGARRRDETGESFVALMVTPGPAAVLGMLAALRAGTAFVPLDGRQPEARLAAILDESGARALITDPSLEARARSLADGRPILVVDPSDTVPDRTSVEAADGVDQPPDLATLAYVIYTSGSTGRPKGVGITHGNLAPTLAWARAHFGFGSQTRVLQSLSYWFDFGVFEILTTVLAGGTMYFLPDDERGDPAHVAARCQAWQIDTLHTTPSLAKEISAGRRLDLRHLHLGGEAVTPDLVAELRPCLAPSCRIHNGYGPTETTINTTLFDLGSAEAPRIEAGETVPIGRPSANHRVYILDPRLEPVPVGVFGELFVGGEGVARGYRGRPRETAERFVPDPFGDAAGGRLYRTGDRVRFRADREVLFAGRVDQQLKLRGFRIEPGEIESALRSLPTVANAAVDAVEMKELGPQLVAWIVAATPEPPSDGERASTEIDVDGESLRRQLAERLPEYMIPAAFVPLDHLPTTPNGKLDYRALPRPASIAPTSTGAPPRTPSEVAVAGIVATVLGVPISSIGRDADFFALGGHSLMATRVIARLRADLGVDLPLHRFFEAPRIADLASAVDALQASGVDLEAGIPRQADDEPPVMSFAQERLWFLDRLNPGDTAYNVPGALRMRGRLDVDRLCAALGALVARHEPLRTAFQDTAAGPRVVVADEVAVEVPLIDLGDEAPGRRQEAFETLARSVAVTPFDLSEPPLLRATLVRFADDEHVLVLVLHHIAFDGWSMGILVRELAAAYETGSSVDLPTLPLRYRDYAAWQRGWLQEGVLEHQIEFWRRELAGVPALRLPLDRRRSSLATGETGSLPLHLDVALIDAARSLASEHGTTLFMTLLAGFQALLGRWTGQTDFAVGTPVAGRRRAELEGLVGLFVNTLALRADLEGEPDFASMLQRVRTSTLQAFAHQDVPFEKLVEVLRPARDTATTPLFQAFFALQNTPSETLTVPDLHLDLLPLETGRRKFDLSVVLAENETGVAGTVEYDRALFDRETIERLASSYVWWLRRLLDTPKVPYTRLPLIDAEVAGSVLATAQSTPASFPVTGSLLDRFVAQAKARPHWTAIRNDGRSISYEALRRDAVALAVELRRAGVGTETRVALFLDRGPELVVAVLGVLGAGGTYVPLDPVYPADRVAFVLDDTNAPVVITEPALRQRLPATDVAVLEIDRLDFGTAATDRVDFPVSVAADQLAYVIYTSGSTGAPKGVGVSHGHVLRLLDATDACFGFDDSDIWTLFHSTAFDFSVWELWGALAYGGALVIVPYWVSRDAEAFRRLLIDEHVTVLNQTPSAFRQLDRVDAASGAQGELALRWVIFGGEALEPRSLAPWFERHGDGHGAPPTGRRHAGPRLVNMYGITETTVHVTVRALRAADVDAPGSVIGTAIPDLALYVLDQAMQPVPFGVAGELYVGGAGVSRGYLGRPALTAHRFVPDPFTDAPGRRLYRTGDRARGAASGEVTYLGRVDHQVQLRGFRVELGEIEAALLGHPGVGDVTVLAREDHDGNHDALLVAHVVPADAADPPRNQALRSFLAPRLPAYMIPTALDLVEALPLTAHGKVDRARLLARPLLGVSRNDAEPPGTHAEKAIAAIWRDVLGIDRVGRKDDFFDLGGHSLLATRVVGRIREQLGADLSLRQIFDTSTLEALAAAAAAVADAATAQPGASIPPRTPDAPVVLSFAQERMWFLDRVSPTATYNLPYALRLRGRLDRAALAGAIDLVRARHEVLRTRFAEVGGVPQPIVEPPRPTSLTTVDLGDLDAQTREVALRQHCRDEARKRFDLGADPVLRTTLLHLGEDDHALLLTMHHIASDGWSIGVLARELVQAYGASRRDQTPALKPLPIQYRDFAAWQRGWLQGEILEAQLGYWRQTLDGVPILTLPTDRPRPALFSSRGAAVTFQVDRPLTGRLEAVGRESGATLFMVLFAAFQAVLGRWSGQRDFAIGTPIAGRRLSETEDLIGYFVNMLAVRADLEGDPTFDDLLERVRAQVIKAFEHQDLPFEQLVAVMPPARDTATPPVFQVSFSYQEDLATEVAFEGLETEMLPATTATTKFDLSFALTHGDQGLRGAIEFSTDLFDETTMQRLVDHYRHLLDAIADRNPRPLSELPMVGAAELRQVLETWNATARPGDGTPLHRQATAIAAAKPRALAVVDAEGTFDHGTLDRRARALASRLRDHGVEAEDRVAVILDRSPELIVAALATLHAGAAYVPMDPALPADRLAFMVEDAGCALILTRDAVAAKVPADVGVETIVVDARAEPAASPIEPATVAPDQLAYVIYTSGSTGKPKGVAVTHRGLANLVAWHRRAFAIEAADRASLVAGTGFDASVWEIWPYLASGATIAIPPAGTVSRPDALVGWLRDTRISVSFLPTPLAEAALAERAIGEVGLRILLTGGDRLQGRPPAGLPFTLVNCYGPTETTVVATAGEVAAEGPVGAPPIGGPIDNLRTLVLGDDLEPKPIGLPGELFLGGKSLARGYLGQPALTAERFVPDPFAGTPGARLYRTGDRVRWLDHGELAFLERVDDQVQVRGFRIELGEIEAALAALPAVARGVVVPIEAERPEGRTETRLVAFVEAAGEPVDGLDERAVRAALGARLPSYMVPSAFVTVDALPLTPNGKVDRKALTSAAVDTETEDAPPSEAPASPSEALVADAFAAVLGVPAESVARHDDFFVLGGHSLLATRLVAHLRDSAGVEVPLARVFEATTVAALAHDVEVLRAGGASLDAAIEARPAEAPPALSFAQERLWFLDRLTPGSSAYAIPAVVRLRGPLDTERLRAALGHVVERHESLRTVVRADEDGQPTAHLLAAGTLDVPIEDLSATPADAVDRAVRGRIEALVASPFDLAEDLLLRAEVLRLAVDEHVLILVMHHIASDGWSVGVLVRELATLYDEPAGLPPLAVQYGDYAAWQRTWLAGEVLDTQLGYWRGQLEGLEPLVMPSDRPRPAVMATEGAAVPVVIDAATVAAATRLARAEGATLFMTLLAAFGALLGRWSGQRDFSLGTPIAGRRRREIEPLVGFFVNTLPLRVDLDGQPSFRELLGRIRSMTIDAYAHQDVPFERLVEELAPRRDPSTPPLVQGLFALMNAPLEKLDLEGLSLEMVPVPSETAKFELSMLLAEQPDGTVAGGFEYRRDLFDAATTSRLVASFQSLLAAALAAPDQPIDRLTALDDQTRASILGPWAGRRTDRHESSIGERFAQVAKQYADAVAVSSAAGSLTYAELDRRSASLATRLRAWGVGPEVAVALCLERSLDLIVATVAVVRAGGYFVPLDPSYPAERLAFMLDDTDAPVLLLHEPLRSALPPLGDGIRVSTVEDALATAAEPASDPPTASPNGPDDLAYIMYTSGSTGRPKGVATPHRAVLRLVCDTDFADFGPGEVFLQFAPSSFDAATLEIWGPLLHGGRLALAPPGRIGLETLAETITSEGVTTAWLTSGLFTQMVDDHVEALGGVRQLLAGGDVLSPPHVAQVLETLPETTMINGYGPTENTTFTCCHPMRRRSDAGEDTVPIGRPIADTTIYLVDEHFEPVPPGVPGHLVVGGAGLARGYFGRPGRTAGVFIPDPFSDRPGARLYVTGDLARWRSDGTVAFLGRADRQIKLRGFRIEPGEIETALVRHPAVARAVIVPRTDDTGKHLVAFLATADPAPDDASLREHLRESLPDFMVPSRFVVLEALPLDANGKVDRKALTSMSLEATVRTDVEHRAPRNDAEGALAAMFAEVLGLSGDRDAVGIDDDFFALGGHSLLATKVISRVRRDFGVELPLQTIFLSPTVAGLAAELAKLGGGEAVAADAAVATDTAASEAKPARQAPPIMPVQRATGDLEPLSFAQERLWFLDRLQPGNAAYHVPAAVRLHGSFDAAHMAEALSWVVARHEALRTVFVDSGSGGRQKVLEAAPVSLPVDDLGGPEDAETGDRLAGWTAEHTAVPFDLEHGPLLRARAARLGADDHVLLLVVHHIVTDGWSMQLLVRELADAYATRQAGGHPAAAPLTVQYPDFSRWQRAWLRGEVLEGELDFWTQALADLPVLELPTDRPRPKIQRLRGASLDVAVAPELGARAAALAKDENATLFMTLLAAFAALLGRWSGQDDFAVGSPIANRNRIETEGLIGFFVNTLALRVRLGGRATFRDLVRQVRDTTLGAYQHQDIPFEKLVEALHPERSLSRPPLFQVMFALQNNEATSVELPGLTLEACPIENRTAKFDLTLSLAETPDGLRGALEYDRDLFDAATMDRFQEHFALTLEALLEAPDRPIDRIAPLTEDERAAVLGPWSRGPGGYPDGPSVPTRFLEQARKTPDRPAVVTPNTTLTFRDLAARMTRLAYLLEELDR